MPFKTCTVCGKPFQPRTPDTRQCAEHELHGREHRSPTTRAQDAEYKRNRSIVLAGDPSCAYCPRPATTVDHVKPVSQGGTNALENLVPACAWCNGSKGASEGWTPGRRGPAKAPPRARATPKLT